MDTIGPLPLPILCLCFSAFCIAQSDATRAMHQFRAAKHFTNSNTKNINPFEKLDTYMPLDSPNTDPPFSLPPYEALPPFALAEDTPPYCVYPPSTPQPPSSIPAPSNGYTPTAPPSSTTPALTPIPPTPAAATTPSSPENPPTIVPSPNPPTYVPSPTEPVFSPNPPTYIPSPTEPVLSPPYYEPSPPSYYEPSPPSYAPGPPQTISPPSRFLPPIVYPPPAVPPPPHRTPLTAMWCVAKAAVPGPIIQEAMNYACFSGAECDQIQPSGSCFQPDTLFAHASYAFNSYWQRTKKAGGSCDFGGTAMLVTVDPSYDGCHFVYL